MQNYFERLTAFCLAAALLLAAASGRAQLLSPLYSFDDTTNDVNRTAGLLLSGNALYATTVGGGSSGGKGGEPASGGAVFKLNDDGTGFTNLYIFSPVDQYSLTNADGANSISPAELVSSGNRLYGTTGQGGFYANGIVFAINSDGTGFTNLHNFTTSVVDSDTGFETNSDGSVPHGLVLSGRTLYGATTGGGGSGSGTVFAMNTDGTGFSNLYSFNPTNGDGSGQKSVSLSGNTLYGTTESGGSSGNGTVFAVNTDSTGFTNLHSFSSLVRMTTAPYLYTNGDGAIPQGGLVSSGNKLYGTATEGGTGNSNSSSTIAYGTVFALNTDGSGFTNLHSFNYGDGQSPYAGLVLWGSTLYGTAELGGSLSQENGTVFAINTNGTGFATLHSFTPRIYDAVSGGYTNADGATPYASLTLSGNTLYGTTEKGGTNGQGTVFGLDLARAAPAIQFTANPTNGVPPMTVQFNSPAVDASSNAILSWNWNFGDGSSSSEQNPSHSYTNSGAFLPTLTCVNNNGSTVSGSGPGIQAAFPPSILNGGFETGTFTNWTESGDYYYSGVATGTKYAHAGKYGAALETGGAMGFLSQTLSTTLGADYLISFWLDSPSSTTPNEFQVSWNGNTLFDETNLGAIGWTNIQLTATATAANTTLQFGYLNGYFYFGLDDISVELEGSAQPGIAQIALSGTNLVISGSGGQSGQTYYVLMGTNLAEPLNEWVPVATNVPGTNGNFVIIATNAVSPNARQRFYILQSP
jgi:uncharacterized repeat protein (TIGR03803 family)